MKKTLTHFLAAIAVGGMSLASIAPVSAQTVTFGIGSRGHYVESYCERHPRDRDCREWRRSGHRWGDDRYRRWYHSHRGGIDSSAAGIFGFAAGAIIGGAIANSLDRPSSSSHIARCEARYRSYDPETDTYMGFDGELHRCRL